MFLKSFGERLPSCSTECFHKKVVFHIPQELQQSIEPVLLLIEQITSQIKVFDEEIEKISNERYPETELLRQIKGVGPLTALAFILTLENWKVQKSRQIGEWKHDVTGIVE